MSLLGHYFFLFIYHFCVPFVIIVFLQLINIIPLLRNLQTYIQMPLVIVANGSPDT